MSNKLDPNNRPAKPSSHISEKVYMFPESFNALRKELVTYHPDIWKKVGYFMIADGFNFVAVMNRELDCHPRILFDTHRVDDICKAFLDACRKRRGLFPLHGNLDVYAPIVLVADGILLREDSDPGKNWFLN